MKILSTLLIAIFAGWAYRDGGSASGIGRWVRQVGMALSMLAVICLWFGWTPWNLLSSLLCFSECTYFKKRGADAVWWNWLLVGLVFAVIPLPTVLALHIGINWAWITGILLIIFVPLWCSLISNVQWSEGGRGAIQILRFLFLCVIK